MKNFYLLCLTLILIGTSCTIEKRVHLSGYHIQHTKSKKDLVNIPPSYLVQNESKKNAFEIANTPIQPNSNQNGNELTASLNNSISFPSSIEHKFAPIPEENTSIISLENIIGRDNKKLPKARTKRLLKKAYRKLANEKSPQDGSDRILLYILALFIPPLAVGIATDWDLNSVVVNCLWTLLCGIPGVIHAFFIISDS